LKTVPCNIVISLNKYLGKKDIKYPQTFTVDKFTYSLVGTIEHIGNVNEGGHYLSRVVRGGSKFLINDWAVFPFENMDSTNETYMIFYEIN
jgi:ubiquitin C-terminal hydrolase